MHVMDLGKTLTYIKKKLIQREVCHSELNLKSRVHRSTRRVLQPV